MLTGQRFRPLWVAAALGWGLFAVFRAGLLLASWRGLEGVAATQVLRCLWIGMWYDAMPIGYAMLPLALMLSLAPERAFRRLWFRRLVAGYVGTVVTLVAGVEIVGAAFFLHFGVRLNWIVVDYVGFQEAGAYIFKNYPVGLLVLVTAGFSYVCYRLFRRTFWSAPRPRGTLWMRGMQAAALAALCVLACRGSFGQPLDQGSAYSCDNNLINQLTMNNVYTFAQAVRSHLEDSRDMAELYPLPPPELAAKVAGELLLQAGDVAVGAKDNPLWRRSRAPGRQEDLNVVVIVMESMAGRPVGALGHSPSHTPFFDSLCREGLFFERMYAVGERTGRGLTAILCGHPDLGRMTVLKRPHALGKFLTLPGVFRERGYRTLFVYGGDLDFDNMGAFFSAGGIQTMLGQDQMDAGGPVGHWGAADEVIFRKADETFRQLGEQKFFAVILTVSNHLPFDVPPGRTEMLPPVPEENKRLNGYRYADWALGEFFRRAREAPYFKRTIFVLVSDHGSGLDWRQILDVPGHRVPCLFYAPGRVSARRVSTVASQTDIAPTLLALLGGTREHCFFGRNLLAVRPGDGFALLNEDDRIGFVRGEYAVVLPPKHRPMLFRVYPKRMVKLEHPVSGRLEALQLQMLSLYTMAHHLYLTSAYRSPAARAGGGS